jgi:hypothetical protein
VWLRAGGSEVGDLDAPSADLLRREGERVEASDDLRAFPARAGVTAAAAGHGELHRER